MALRSTSTAKANRPAVWGSDAANVYAAGDNGTILHYDGSAWQPAASNVTVRLRGLWGTAANDIYAVGEGGTILHFDGSSWSPETGGTVENLYGVWTQKYLESSGY